MHLLLVDGSTYIFRAYHALPPLTRKSDGLPVGCVAGFCNMIWKLTEDLKGDDAPTHMAVIFDYSAQDLPRPSSTPNTRRTARRRPRTLVPQFPLTRAATRAFGFPSIEMERLGGRRHHRHLCLHRRATPAARSPSSPPTRT